MEPLLIAEVRSRGIGVRERVCEDICWQRAIPIDLHRSCQNRIKRRYGRAYTRRRRHQARCSSSCAARTCRCTARSATCGSATHARACSARRTLHDASIYAPGRLARFGAPDIGIGNVQVVARNRDVEVILERQRYRVVH